MNTQTATFLLISESHISFSPDLDHLRSLLSGALSRGYGGSEPCEELRATILEAEICSSKALQLASRKQVTTRGSAEVAEKRMGVDELVKFVEQVEALPCNIPEADILLVSMYFMGNKFHEFRKLFCVFC